MKKLILIIIFLLIALPTLASETSGMLYAEVIQPEGQNINELIKIMDDIMLLLKEIQLTLSNI